MEETVRTRSCRRTDTTVRMESPVKVHSSIMERAPEQNGKEMSPSNVHRLTSTVPSGVSCESRERLVNGSLRHDVHDHTGELVSSNGPGMESKAQCET